MNYKAYFEGNISKYYADSNLLFSVESKVPLHNLSSECKIYNERGVIFSFYILQFLITWRLKILSQNLDKEVKIEVGKLDYDLIVENKKIHLNFTSNPFSKKICEIYVNKVYFGEITKEFKDAKYYFMFNFNQTANLEFYVLILFSMHSIILTSDS